MIKNMFSKFFHRHNWEITYEDIYTVTFMNIFGESFRDRVNVIGEECSDCQKLRERMSPASQLVLF